MSATLHGAYDLARAGYTLVPNYAPVEGGCSCTEPTCHARGKHPIGGDSKHATKDPKAIRGWARSYPAGFNVGIQLEQSELLDIAPDCPEREAEFQRLGLPPGAMIWRSGSGDGHRHHLYRRPAGCPITKINRSGDFDIMAIGMAVAPPSVSGKGPYIWETPIIPRDELPEAPAWAVAMIIEHGEKQGRTERRASGASSVTGDVGDADEPPIDLNTYELAIWKGEQPKQKTDGTTDRSATLLKIARVLYDNGMTRRGVVSELQDRDHALGFHKYCCTASRAGEYGRIMDKLEATGRTARVHLVVDDEPAPLNGQNGSADEAPDSDAGCPSCEKLTIAYNALAARHAALQRDRAAEHATLGNEGLTPAERIAGIVTALHVVAARRKGKADEDGAVPTFLPKVAERAGLPERTYSRTLKGLEAHGWAEKRVARVRAYDPVTRTRSGDYVSQLRVIVPGETVEDALAPLAALKPERVRAGGARPRQCVKHPEADIYRRTTYHCAVCHEVVERTLDVDEETGEVFGDVRPLNGHNGSPNNSGIDGQNGNSDERDAADERGHQERALLAHEVMLCWYPRVRMPSGEVIVGKSEWDDFIREATVEELIAAIDALPPRKAAS